MIIYQILLFAFISFVVIVGLNIVGKPFTAALFSLSEERPHYNFFLECVMGLTTLVTVYSCIYTRCVTINLGFGILFAFLFFANKNYINYFNNLKLRFISVDYRIWMHISLLCLLISFLNVIYPLAESIGNDVLFYAKIGENLARFGRENMFHEYNGVVGEFRGTSPYHYFDLWLGSILFKCFGNYFTNVIIFKYIGYTILKVTAICGLLSLIENFKKKIFITDVLIVVALSTFNFLYLTELGGNDWILYHDMWLRPNIAVYIIFLALCFNSLLLKNFRNAILFALFLPIASTVTAPAVFLGMILLIICLLMFREIKRKEAFLLVIPVLIMAIFAMLFYKYTAVDAKVLSADNRSFMQMLGYSASIYKAVIFFLVTLSLRTIFMLLFPCILLILLLKNGKALIVENKYLLLGALCIALSGITVFQLFPFVDNTYQFPYVGYAACFILALLLLYRLTLSIQFARSKVIVFIFSAAFVLFNIMRIRHNLDFEFRTKSVTELELKRVGAEDGFIQKLEKYFSRKDISSGGFIFAETDIRDIYPGMRHSLTYQLGNYLAYLRSDLFLVSLTSPEVLYGGGFINDKFYLKAYGFNRLAPFYRNYHHDNYPEELKKYILENRLHFLMVSKNFDLKQLDYLAIKEEYTDSGTGSKLIVLE
jgi:hypothetical protein